MIAKRLSLFLFLLGGQIGLAQAVYQAEWPEHLTDHPAYRQLEGEEVILLDAIRSELQQASSENVRFYLNLAIQNLETGGKANLTRRLAQLAERRSLEGLDPAALLAWAEALIALRERRAQLEAVYRCSGPSMPAYLPDTTRPDLLQELAFYDLQPGDRIAELGAGTGAFSAAVAATVDSITLYINELDTALLDQIAYQVRYNPVFRRPGSRTLAIQGSRSATGLQQQPVDAVIIRNAIHHFEYLDDMLRALREALAVGGKLLLRERFREDCRANCCPALLSEAYLRRRLEAAGFHLVGFRTIDDRDGPWRLTHWEWQAP